MRLMNADITDSLGHFFAAAAEAMRRILVENARRKASLKRGGDLDRIDLPEIAQSSEEKQIDLQALDEALSGLEQTHPENAGIIKLRFPIKQHPRLFDADRIVFVGELQHPRAERDVFVATQ